MRTTRYAILAALSLVAVGLAPAATAHTTVTVVDNPDGPRCYITHPAGPHAEEPTFWKEINGVTTGGLDQGPPLADHQVGNALGTDGFEDGSGLQTVAGDHDDDGAEEPADTQLSEDEFALECGGA
jgi:hypothetical protein